MHSPKGSLIIIIFRNNPVEKYWVAERRVEKNFLHFFIVPTFDRTP